MKKPEEKFVYKPKTVRGRERRKLQGWDCNDCKKVKMNQSW